MEDQSYKEYLHEILINYYDYFNSELSKVGNVYIAGGAVRDTLIGREPKDYNIFILNDKKSIQLINEDIKKFVEKNEKLELSKLKNKKFGESANEAAANFRFNGCEIQLIAKNNKNVGNLLDNFDFNVCKFAFGITNKVEKKDFLNCLFRKPLSDEKSDYIYKCEFSPTDIENRIATLRVNKINETNPIKTLHRAFYLENKLGLNMDFNEYDKIFDIINEKRYGKDFLKKINGNKEYRVDDWSS